MLMQQEKILKLVENLEELEDVKAVHANYDIDDALLGQFLDILTIAGDFLLSLHI